MDSLMEYLQTPMIQGLIVVLILVVVAWLTGVTRRKKGGPPKLDLH